MVKHFIENAGAGEAPKTNKYKKYGAVHSNTVRICMASIVAIAHSPFYTGEYYSKLSPLWQQIANKVKPTYKVVFRSAVDELVGSSGILWRPIILPNCYKNLVNSETDVFDDISIMPWHSFSNVKSIRRVLSITKDLPSSGKSFREIGTQTDEFPVVVAATTKEVERKKESNRVKIREQKSLKLDIMNRDVMKVFNKMMERELHRYEATRKYKNKNQKRMNDDLIATNQWFPVVAIKRSRSIENLMCEEREMKRKPQNSTI